MYSDHEDELLRKRIRQILRNQILQEHGGVLVGGAKDPKRSAAAKIAAAKNPWLKCVAEYRNSYPLATYQSLLQAMKKAKAYDKNKHKCIPDVNLTDYIIQKGLSKEERIALGVANNPWTDCIKAVKEMHPNVKGKNLFRLASQFYNKKYQTCDPRPEIDEELWITPIKKKKSRSKGEKGPRQPSLWNNCIQAVAELNPGIPRKDLFILASLLYDKKTKECNAQQATEILLNQIKERKLHNVAMKKINPQLKKLSTIDKMLETLSKKRKSINEDEDDDDIIEILEKDIIDL